MLIRVLQPHITIHFDIDEAAFKYAASEFLKILELESVFNSLLNMYRKP